MQKILVTGAPGWLGNRLVSFLNSGYPDIPALSEVPQDREIRCLALPGLDTRLLRSVAPKAKLVEGDLTREASLSEFFNDAKGAVVLHLAGLIHPKRWIRDVYRVNADGTRHILNWSKKAGVRRVVVVSSNSPCGYSRNPNEAFNEDAPYKPYMAYGRSKKTAEDLTRKAGAAGDFETVLLRPCWFYGPFQPPRQSVFFTMIKEGKGPIVGGGTGVRSMSYVDNTCQAIMLAMQSAKAAGQTYWVADKRPYSMNEIVDTVERLLEHEFKMPVAHKRLRLPGLASEVAMGIDAFFQMLGLYQQKIHVLSEMNKTIACRVDKAERELGYKPLIDLEEGMRRSICWCLENGQNI
jgi:nucleoside-diphosphate-sugar epimerase